MRNSEKKTKIFIDKMKNCQYLKLRREEILLYYAVKLLFRSSNTYILHKLLLNLVLKLLKITQFEIKESTNKCVHKSI